MAKGSGGAGRTTGRAAVRDTGGGGGISVGFAPGEDISQWAVPASARAYRSPAPTAPKKKAAPKMPERQSSPSYNLAKNKTLRQLLSERAKGGSKQKLSTLDRAISIRADMDRRR